LRFIVWSFLKARLLFVLDQFNGATSLATPFVVPLMWGQLENPGSAS
jgi:hypothetical protein